MLFGHMGLSDCQIDKNKRRDSDVCGVVVPPLFFFFFWVFREVGVGTEQSFGFV